MAAIETLKSLRDQVLFWLDESDDTGTTYTIVNNAINQAHQQRLVVEPWSFMIWDSVESFTASIGTTDYILHSEFNRPLWFRNRASTQLLREIPFRMAEQSQDTTANTQQAAEFYLQARDCVAIQPLTSQLLRVVSSSSFDTAGPTLIIRGVTNVGVISEVLTLTGVTPVTTVNAFSKVLNVTKTGSWAGTLTLTAVTDVATLLQLTASEYGRSYQRLTFLQKPNATDVIEYAFYRLPSALVNDYDIPDIPPPYSQILVWDALLMISGYNSDVGSAAINTWKDNQGRLELAMTRAFQDGTSLGAGPRSIRYVT